jgi:1,2-diacylglycerol 3-alpha-glucosyltransferase
MGGVSMKILLTTDTYCPMINGVVISTMNLYTELKKLGHDVKIMTLSHRDEEWIDGDVYYLKSFKTGIYPDARIMVPFINSIIKEIINWKPDIIHSQTEFSVMLAAKYIARKLNIPQIHTYHTMYEDYLCYIKGFDSLKKSAVTGITRLLLNSFQGIVAPTEKTERALMSYGVKNDMYIIPTGINLNKFQKDISLEERKELREKLGINEHDSLLIYVGRVAKEKNLSEIISLMRSVKKNNEGIKLLVVGDGPYLETLKEEVKQTNLDNTVLFTGMVKPEEIYKYYKLGDVFVTASTSETQGLTYLEALSSGCPVVCRFDKCVEGIIIDGKNGFVYKKTEEFSRYIIAILSDEKLRANLSREAAMDAHMYSSEVFAENIFNAYNKVLCQSRLKLAYSTSQRGVNI